jgi:iron(III) transport system ATP-binding protein
MASLTVENVRVTLGSNEILKGIDTSFLEGEIVVLLGRSGSGKTTLLRSIAGLEQPTAGRITIGDKTVFDAAKSLNIPTEKRNLGLVFQSYALWPHKTVHDNVAYGLSLRGISRNDAAPRVAEVLERIGLGHLAQRYPSQLSGGQQQRVALARAIVYSPPVILLDEPLSNLDAKLREEARIWIRGLIKKLGLTAIFVTHDQVEAMAIADRVILLEDGVVVQTGNPLDLYTDPKTLFASEFMGSNNSIATTIEERNGKYVRVNIAGADMWALNRTKSDVNGPATAVIRLEEVLVETTPSDNCVFAELDMSVYLGGRWEHVFRCGDSFLRAIDNKPRSPGSHWLRMPRDLLWAF